MTYNIEEKMVNLVAIKNTDSSQVASPVGERNVGPSDEIGPAGEFTNVGIPIPVINDETVRITFPLFYFGEGFNVPTSVNVLQNETVEELLPVNFTKILKSYFDDILSHAAQKWEEESKKQLNSSTVTAVTVSLGISIISCLVILAVNLTFSVIVLLIALIVMGFCWFWWCHYIRIKAKRTWEREVFKRLDSYCKQLTKASPRLFQKEITIQMIKSFDHDYSTIKSAQLYRISDPSGNDIYTRVYFHVSFDIVQGNSKPDNMYEVDINQPSMLKQ
ncbi:hypothetical protein BKA69DRAFT_1106632 [Paraphysoderma sedebokerense]|nr:hypothetical protein BKA69DRAFT_1106614 [Paraphysoderma sedebokerense]KAI9136059.1 hypothetical protein BKA69DRAFT_1106624 [Paraphysoderma sedebokerense]KAI9136060.1 hypothetical protein BKA69DRAFT_1106632 [Paraphysoderma sedebokerense]